MIYLYVDKNPETQKWEILKTYNGPINVRGKSGITYGDISSLTLEQRLAECIWTSADQYDGAGEYMEYDYTETVFDDVNGVVISVYHYKLMDLNIIKSDLDTRITQYRDQLLYSGFEYNSKKYNSSTNYRVILHGYVIQTLVDSTVTSVAVRLEDDTDEAFTVAELRALLSAMSSNTEATYLKERTLRDNLAAASTYEDARAAATWDGVPL